MIEIEWGQRDAHRSLCQVKTAAGVNDVRAWANDAARVFGHQREMYLRVDFRVHRGQFRQRPIHDEAGQGEQDGRTLPPGTALTA